MTLPVLSRTHQFQVSQIVPGGTYIIQNQAGMWALTQSLTGQGVWTDAEGATVTVTAPLTIISSSGWASQAGLTWNAPGSAHSWIVLGLAGVATNCHLLIDLRSTSNHIARMAISHTGYGAAFGGADGTATTAPTALNEIPLNSTGAPFGFSGNSGVPASTVLHVSISTDGKTVLVDMCRNSFMTGHLWVVVPTNTPAGWTNKYIALQKGIDTQVPVADVLPFASLCADDTTNPMVGCSNAGTSFRMLPDTRGLSGSNKAYPQIFTTIGDVSLAYPFFAILLGGNTGGSFVDPNLGLLPDIGYGLISQTTGAQYPGDEVAAGERKQWTKLGPVVRPWDKTSVVIA